MGDGTWDLNEEKRKAKRITKVLFARYVPETERTQEKWDMVGIKNISETGICLPTSEFFPPGQVLTILLKIPLRPMEWVEFKGKVINSERLTDDPNSSVEMYLVRAEFLNVKDDLKGLLKQYISMFKK